MPVLTRGINRQDQTRRLTPADCTKRKAGILTQINGRRTPSAWPTRSDHETSPRGDIGIMTRVPCATRCPVLRRARFIVQPHASGQPDPRPTRLPPLRPRMSSRRCRAALPPAGAAAARQRVEFFTSSTVAEANDLSPGPWAAPWRTRQHTPRSSVGPRPESVSLDPERAPRAPPAAPAAGNRDLISVERRRRWEPSIRQTPAGFSG